MKLPQPGKRALLAVALAAAAGVGGLAFHLTRDDPGNPAAPRGKPPAGAYSIESKEGRTDFSVQTEQGRVDIRAGSAAPADMPYDFPLYPGAVLRDSVSLAGATAAGGRLISFTSGDSPDKIVAHYRKLARAALLRIVTDERIGTAWILEGVHLRRADGGFHLSVRNGPEGGSEAMLSAGFGQDVTHRPEPDSALAETDILLSPPGATAVP